MTRTQLEVPVRGMDCAECTQHVQQALAALPGVKSVQVYLTSEKAAIQYDPAQVNLIAFQAAVDVHSSDPHPLRAGLWRGLARGRGGGMAWPL
jgi:copper chaperone CopZ